MRIFNKVLTTSLLVIWDTFAVAASVVIGLGLRYDFSNTDLNNATYYEARLELFLLVMILMLLSNVVCRCYASVWKHAGISEYLRQIIAVLLCNVILAVLNARFQFIPPELIISIACLELLLVLGARASIRMFYWLQSRMKSIRARKGMRRVAVFGAGEAGISLVRRLQSQRSVNPGRRLNQIPFIERR